MGLVLINASSSSSSSSSNSSSSNSSNSSSSSTSSSTSSSSRCLSLLLNNVKNKLCMIANSDIFLYESDNKLIEQLHENKFAYALTRYEHDMTCQLINGYGGSHDAYIFNSKYLNDSIINEHTHFYQNFPGIETHIIKTFCDNGFKVFNPCKQIKIVHLHKTNLRCYGNWIGLHKQGDYDFHQKNCWWVPPIIL